MRLQLAVLAGRGACRDDAQLAPPKVEAGSAQHLSIAFRDHPLVEERMQLPNVDAQPLVHRTIDVRAHALTGDAQIWSVAAPTALGRRGPDDTPPGAHAIQRAWESREQVRLQQ